MKSLNELYVWYEKLSKESVENIKDYYAEEAFFKDPFNEVLGREKIQHIFNDMFIKLENPHFYFIDKIEQGNQAFVTWNFIFVIKQKTYTIHGSSHLKLNESMMIIYHRDYWDVGEELLLKVPLIKNLYGVIRKKMGSS
jgi:ketosteroid isomerase-like protein